MNRAKARETAAQAWCTPLTIDIELEPRLAIAFAHILHEEVEKVRKASWRCPECGTNMVISDQAGIEAMESLAEDRSKDILQAADALCQAAWNFRGRRLPDNKQKLDDAMSRYRELRRPQRRRD